MDAAVLVQTAAITEPTSLTGAGATFPATLYIRLFSSSCQELKSAYITWADICGHWNFTAATHDNATLIFSFVNGWPQTVNTGKKPPKNTGLGFEIEVQWEL